jgi:two-component system sensor histidine kinase ResE
VNEQLLLAGLREQELADQLRRQLAFTGAITDHLGEGIYVVDRDCRITFVNPAAARLLGWTAAGLLGRDAQGLLPCPLAEVMRAGRIQRDDAEFTRRDGGALPVAYSAAAIGDMGAVVAFRDITERKHLDAARQRLNADLEARVAERTAALRAAYAQLEGELAARHLAEAALREREVRLRLLLEQTPAIVWTTDAELRFTFAAGAALSVLHIAPGQLIGLHLRDLASPVGDDGAEENGAGTPPMSAHLRALAGKSGSYAFARHGHTFQVYVEPLRTPGGAIDGTIAIAQDITELSLRRLHDEFIATVSHQLLTPLAAAKAGLGLLNAAVAERLGPDERRLFATIERNVGRLGIHLNDLLTLNQLKAGTLAVAPVVLDLRAVVADAMGVIHPLLREKGQDLAVDLPERLPVAGDAEELAQAVINLLANAHRHTPGGTRVAVAGGFAGEEVILTVSDAGPGIPAGAREAVFQRFHRLAVPGGPPATGSGLGLAIVRGIVELHGGRVWVADAPGGGAAFHIALPRADK